jgi:[CysO sulfur-carrier protein]-S-L-cysteine hydrolase
MNARPSTGMITRPRFSFREAAPEDTTVSSLVLPRELRAKIVTHLCLCRPDEGVGLLAASRRDSALVAVRFYPGRNIDSSPQRYTMDPGDVMAALADMRRRETRLGAIVHSHPNTSPVPSRTDLAEANSPGVLSLIVGLSPEIEVRAWSFGYDDRGDVVRWEEVPISERS